MQRRMARPRSTRCSRSSVRRPRQNSSLGATFFVGGRSALRNWQPHDKGRSNSVGIVARRNFSAMRSHDAITDAESQTCAFAYFLGGEKRVENAVGVGNTCAIIAKYNLD